MKNDHDTCVWGKTRPILNQGKFDIMIYRDKAPNTNKLCIAIHSGHRGRWSVSTNFSTVDDRPYLGLRIYNTESVKPSIFKRKYYIAPTNGNEAYSKTFVSNKTGAHDPFIAVQDFSKYVDCGRIRIFCEVTDYIDSDRKLEIEVPECNRESLGHLFESREFSDVTIVDSKKKEIRVHKAILAAESTVFSAMFKSPMMENDNNRVDIIDVEPEVLEEMLRFVYTQKIAKLEEMAFDLLAAADKYNLQKLKINCEAAICKKMLVENCVDVLIHADLHQAQNLKKKAIDFIVRHFKNVKETKSYKTMVPSNGSLLGELLELMYDVHNKDK